MADQVEAVSTKETQLTKLLDFIKRQKLKIKKLETDNSELLEKLAAASNSEVVLSTNSPSSGNSPNSTIELLRSKSPSHKLLVKSSLRCLFRYSQNSKSSPVQYFNRWKVNAQAVRLAELEQKLEETTKNSLELEKRCLKLKGLLSRTHQANKQQSEDTNAFKRAQREATQELRNHAQEKLALLEEVRARDIESAFHQDLEIYIQKAAEGLVSQHQLMQQQLQSQSQGTVSKTLLKELEEENGRIKKAADELRTKELEASSRFKETKIILQKAEKSLSVAEDKIKELEARNRVIERQLQDEICGRRELEVELELISKSRVTMLSELESACESKIEKITSETAFAIDELQKQSEELRKNLNAALDDVSKFSNENAKLRRESMSRDNANEVARLRNRVLEYKKLMKSGTIVSLAGGEPMLQDIIETSSFFDTQAKRAQAELIQCRKEANELSNYITKILHDVLSVVGERLVPYASGSIPFSIDPSSRTQATRMKEDIQSLENEMAGLKSSALDPMVWEASSVTIQAGKDIAFTIPIASPASGQKIGATLDWTYTGSQAGLVSLSLLKPNGSASQSLLLQSIHNQHHDVVQYKGSHRVSSLDGDRILKLGTSSIWGPVTISYFIRLQFDTDSNSSNLKNLISDLESKRLEHDKLATRMKLAEAPLMLFQKLSTRAATFSEQWSDKLGSSESRLSEIHEASKRFSVLKAEASKGFRTPMVEISTPLTLTKQLDGTRSGSPSSGIVSVLNCESLKIRASDDFRVYIPSSFISRPFKLVWSFELQARIGDIGFTILEQEEDGALPTLIPYRRVKESSGELIITGKDFDVVVLFDNTFSWARSKDLKCSIQVNPVAPSEHQGVSDSQLIAELSPSRLESLFPSRSLHETLPPSSDLVQLIQGTLSIIVD